MIVTVKDPICRMVYFGGGLAFESAGSAAFGYFSRAGKVTKSVQETKVS
ncbi:MAG: hypothetical protein KH006_01240 [Firmicutes bacterium]|nr:hypothetical protein [Bacillota bacterium]